MFFALLSDSEVGFWAGDSSFEQLGRWNYATTCSRVSKFDTVRAVIKRTELYYYLYLRCVNMSFENYSLLVLGGEKLRVYLFYKINNRPHPNLKSCSNPFSPIFSKIL